MFIRKAFCKKCGWSVKVSGLWNLHDNYPCCPNCGNLTESFNSADPNGNTENWGWIMKTVEEKGIYNK